MDKGTITKIISAVAGLVLVGFGAWLASSDEAGHSDLLIYAGLAVIAGGLGTAALPSALPARKGPPRPPPLPVLLALALLSGCGGPPGAMRAVVANTAGGLNVADQVLEARIHTRAAAVRAELVQMAHEGRVASVEAGLDWYDAQLEPERTAERVLRAAKASLLAVEDALDAWAAGAANGPQAFAEAVACSVAALADVVDVLTAVGLEVPEVVTTWAPVVSQYATTGCPEPDPPAPPAHELAPDGGAS